MREEADMKESETRTENGETSDGAGGHNSNNDVKPASDEDENDYAQKSDQAVDYSDINELADDLQTLMAVSCFQFSRML